MQLRPQQNLAKEVVRQHFVLGRRSVAERKLRVDHHGKALLTELFPRWSELVWSIGIGEKDADTRVEEIAERRDRCNVA